ncbi:MAG: serine/threonine-protein kinase, partial [Elusimicrobia bacterium]|nr:serine/threonine-protein kinase [Elusimicrobiota bacterium]
HAVAEEPPSSPPASRPSPTEDLVAAPPAEPVSVEHTVAEEPPQQYQAPEAQPGSPDDTLLGRQVGPCRVEALLGRGGMGAVYRAHHIPLDRPVALKVVSPEWLGSPAAAAAFVAEARIAARLEDPRIVQVYDVGVYGEQTYIVMQFLPGENLEAKVGRDGPLPPAEALRVIKEAALALAAAHRQGVVHRDVKPANIMLGPDGSVRLMDFGISVMTGRSEAQPEGISTMGSFDFMAPEQAFGGPPDPRMDLYSLGATYFYTLTARPPYEAKNAGDLLLRHREAPLPDVRELRPEVTAAVAGLIKRLMAKNPAARPAGAGHVLRELESPRMLLDVEASGSPFKLLPPPPEKEEEGFDSGAGFAPMAPAAPEEPEPAPEPAPAASPAPAAPHVVASSPLPPLPTAPAHRRQVVKVAAGVVGLAVMARLWHGTDRPDWAAAGVFAAAAAAFCLAQAGWRPWLRGLASGLAGVGMAAAFYRFGAGAFAWPAQTPDLDFFGLAAPGLVAAAAAFYLGVWTVDRRAAAGLMVGAGALLLLAAFSLQLPPEADWLQGVRGAAAQQGRRFVASGGLWRWGGLLALFLAGLFLWRRRSRSARSGQGPAILNWNR